MNKLLISLLSAAALGLPLTSAAQQAPAMPAAPVAQPEQATAPAVTNPDSATAKKAKKAFLAFFAVAESVLVTAGAVACSG